MFSWQTKNHKKHKNLYPVNKIAYTENGGVLVTYNNVKFMSFTNTPESVKNIIKLYTWDEHFTGNMLISTENEISDDSRDSVLMFIMDDMSVHHVNLNA